MEQYTFNGDTILFEEISNQTKDIYLNGVKNNKYLVWTHFLDLSDIIYLTTNMTDVYYEQSSSDFQITEDIAFQIYEIIK